MERRLEEEGFDKFETTLGCDGIGVLWPAILKNGIEDDLGGEEIDQDKFLNADGIEGVEELVGHGAAGHVGDGLEAVVDVETWDLERMC